MPRKAREKSPESVYHIMCRSESEFLLFRDDEDKDYYLGLLKKDTLIYTNAAYMHIVSWITISTCILTLKALTYQNLCIA